MTKLIGRDVTIAKLMYAGTTIDLVSNTPDGEADWMSMTTDFTANAIDVSGVSNTWKNFRSGQLSGTITVRARKADASRVLSTLITAIGAGAAVAFEFKEASGGKSIAGSGYFTADRNDFGGIDTIQTEEITIMIDGTPTIT